MTTAEQLQKKMAKQRNEIARLSQALEDCAEQKRTMLRELRELRTRIEAMPHHKCEKCGEDTPEFAMSTVKEGTCDECQRLATEDDGRG